MNEDVKDACSENEDAEERELEKAYQNVHVNVSLPFIQPQVH